MAVSESTRRQRERWCKVIADPNADKSRVIDEIQKSCLYGGTDERIRRALAAAIHSNFAWPSVQVLAAVGASIGIGVRKQANYNGAYRHGMIWYIMHDIRDVQTVFSSEVGLTLADVCIAKVSSQPGGIPLFESLKGVEEFVCSISS